MFLVIKSLRLSYINGYSVSTDKVLNLIWTVSGCIKPQIQKDSEDTEHDLLTFVQNNCGKTKSEAHLN